MNVKESLSQVVINTIEELYATTISQDSINIQKTRKEFEGDFTLMVFPFVKISKKNPDITAKEIGDSLKNKLDYVESFNVVKGFLNISLKHTFWLDFLQKESKNDTFGHRTPSENTSPILLEFSSPNTNKPLHLGHIRNNLLGDAIARILTANGKNVIRLNLVNDRGIHICKSMLMHQKHFANETPQSTNTKGDKLVGKYYVAFDKQYKNEIEQLAESGIPKDVAEKKAPILLEAQEMLRKWEDEDKAVRVLWQTMNQWVYQGFDLTYKRLGIHFDKTYYESDTYLLGKKIIEEGLKKHVFYQHEDGSIRIDLQADGLDEKILLRADGTSVYITQDIGNAVLRYEEYQPSQLVYVVGNEQNYHFDVLRLILAKKLAYPWANRLFHLSYGMVELPSGKMKSREGTVVDADDLMDEMVAMAKQKTEELGKTAFSDAEIDELSETIGLGALKYFILKVDPKKNILFNPDESIDLNGNTAPFIQYTYARICSLLRKSTEASLPLTTVDISRQDTEKEILRLLYAYPETIETASEDLNPSLIANYIYELVKVYNRFYQETPILKEENQALRLFRLHLSAFTARTVSDAMSLLGINMPERM